VVRLRRRDVGHDGPVEEGVGPASGAVDELVAQHEVAGMDVALEAACRAWTDDRPDSECAEGPHVGPVVDAMGRDRMPSAVAGHGTHPPAGYIRQAHAVGSGAVWRVELELGDVLDQRVDARLTEV